VTCLRSRCVRAALEIAALGSLAALGCKEASKANANGAPAGSIAVASSSRVEVAASERSRNDLAIGATAARTVAGATMKVLEAGQPPRRRLRYAWRLDQKEQLSLELRTAVSTEGGGATQAEVSLPSVHVTIDIDPQSVTPDGDLRYQWRVTSATVDAAGDTPTNVAEGIRAEVADIAHLSGSSLIDCRGLAKEVTGDAGAVGSGLAAPSMAEQVRQTLRDVAAPFPEEEVGIGARWRKLSQLDEKEALVTQAETFRLVDLHGTQGTLDDALAQTAPPQALHGPGMPPGTRARMESMLASGQAKVRFDLSRLVPQTAFDGTTTMVLSGQTAGDTARNVRTVMHVFFAIAGSRR
jgi:hypothetical protein